MIFFNRKKRKATPRLRTTQEKEIYKAKAFFTLRREIATQIMIGIAAKQYSEHPNQMGSLSNYVDLAYSTADHLMNKAIPVFRPYGTFELEKHWEVLENERKNKQTKEIDNAIEEMERGN